MIYIDENDVRFTLVTDNDLTGASLEMEFRKPDKTQPNNKAATIGDVAVSLSGVTYQAINTAYFNRVTDDFLDVAGAWQVRLIRTQTAQVLKSDWIQFNVEE